MHTDSLSPAGFREDVKITRKLSKMTQPISPDFGGQDPGPA
ncbi:hypothetical protein RSSM_06248 [Rhodopirellula sallentina SM41]|uniref:Uncharacterized protein n=1 Tax=Rhodopirellula sallentina SM41 TaxID=1263870 RepID=M5U378_9BACT|nr:hypothetical protein RSSM_06248 [Rhodopirellula sallentina SM41]